MIFLGQASGAEKDMIAMTDADDKVGPPASDLGACAAFRWQPNCPASTRNRRESV